MLFRERRSSDGESGGRTNVHREELVLDEGGMVCSMEEFREMRRG